MSIAKRIVGQLPASATHHAGTLGNNVLCRLERLIGSSFERTMETGCGKSTLFFSQASKNHLCFAVDDRAVDQSSVSFVQASPMFQAENCRFIFGPTQKTLPAQTFDMPFDVVLLDGPHGYPFPELEYYFIYPHIRQGGYLIVDDVHLPTIGRFADVLFEDPMFELVETVLCTAVFRRTSAPTFDPTGDGWSEQPFNRRRISPKKGKLYLGDRTPVDHFSSRHLDEHLESGRIWVVDDDTPPLGTKFAIAGLEQDALLPAPGRFSRIIRSLTGR